MPSILGSSGRRNALALLVVFSLPLLFAWLFSAGALPWLPDVSLNRGVLLDPPVRLNRVIETTHSDATAALEQPGEWYLIAYCESGGDEECRRWSQIAERLKLAVGRNSHRVKLASLGSVSEALAPDARYWEPPREESLRQALATALADDEGAGPPESTLLVVDFRGAVVLAYPSTEDGTGVLSDLKRLLRGTALVAADQ